MTIGFKTGPRTWKETKVIIIEDKARFCEMWFNVNHAGQYEDKFSWLTAHGAQVGLHHWGLINGRIKPNLCAADAAIREKTIDQIKRTIDIARRINAAYVNIHPGARALEEINFDNKTQKLVPDSWATLEQAWQFLSQSARALEQYARERNILLTIETLPGREAEQYEERENIYDAGNPPLDWFIKLGQQGNYIANDITHTTSVLAVTNNDPAAMWQGLIDFTQQTAAHTRLIHLNTMTPPFNGTDSHNGLVADDWAAGAWPNLDQIRQLLTIFKDRKDLFVIPEPREHMRENYQALRNFQADLVKNS